MKKITLYTLYFVLIVSGLLQIAEGLDLQYSHYEDGSGRITYCLPAAICND